MIRRTSGLFPSGPASGCVSPVERKNQAAEHLGRLLWIRVIILSCKRTEMLGCSNSPSSVRRAEPDPFMGVSLLLQPSPHSKRYDFFFEVGAGLMSFE